MYIKRALEEVVTKTNKAFKAILVTGARQVGKSTLLKHLFNNIKYVTFDDPLLKEATKRDPKLFIKQNKAPILLDEIQYVTELFPYIKMECDNTDAYGLYALTGSQQYHLMKNVSESLSGRIAILELAGLSMREMKNESFNEPFIPSLNYIENREKTLNKNLNIWQIIHRGSYPALINSEIDTQIFYSSYIDTYISRDINDLIKIKDKLKFTQFLVAMASRTGQILNYSSVADQLEISAVTVKEWTSILETSGLIYILRPFSNSALNRAIKTPKLYFRETGLVCYLTRYPNYETAMNGAMAGALFETFVVSEIIKSFQNAGIRYDMHISYYRSKDKVKTSKDGIKSNKEAEIDLIIEDGNIIYPIEIKLSANPKLSMTNSLDVLDRINNKQRGNGTIICMYDSPIWLNEHTVALPVEYI